ncbi:MAG: class A beta-lactamase, subclass A2 [Bacteroidetes bacterium]|nr:class A beta-lactamase, subclass A2 [Bacteroidota bacterium]
MTRRIIFICTLHLLTFQLFAGPGKTSLDIAIRKVIDSAHAKVGVAALALDFHDRFFVKGKDHFPMQSVFKFPLALYTLHLVDEGKLSLLKQVHIPLKKLDPDTWSPMLKDFPSGDIDMSLSELLRYAVSKSDNNACDVLFGLTGGTTNVDHYIHTLGIMDIAISATEAEMKKAWHVQYTNWCTPQAMSHLLRLFYEEKLLKKESNTFLMDLMLKSENSSNRIKGLLPAGTIVAHKTGTSNTNAGGVTAATNDAGVITLPNGRHLALVVFVSDYKGGVPKGEEIIARISRLIWDYYANP